MVAYLFGHRKSKKEKDKIDIMNDSVVDDMDYVLCEYRPDATTSYETGHVLLLTKQTSDNTTTVRPYALAATNNTRCIYRRAKDEKIIGITYVAEGTNIPWDHLEPIVEALDSPINLKEVTIFCGKKIDKWLDIDTNTMYYNVLILEKNDSVQYVLRFPPSTKNVKIESFLSSVCPCSGITKYELPNNDILYTYKRGAFIK
jgi:hypothetical protein